MTIKQQPPTNPTPPAADNPAAETKPVKPVIQVDKSWMDKLPGGKPSADKPAAPAAEKPAEAKPMITTGRPGDKPLMAKPADKPPAQKPPELVPPVDTSPKPATPKPVDKPVADKPPAQKPPELVPPVDTSPKPALAKPADKPVEKPADKPVELIPPVATSPRPAEKPADKPVAAKPVPEKPAADKLPSVTPPVDKPAADKPAAPAAPTVADKPLAAAAPAAAAAAPPADAAGAESVVQAPKPVRLGEKLVQLGLISADQLQVVLTEQKNTKKLMGAVLVEMGFITESALGEVLAESSGTKKFDPKATMLDSSIVRRIPKDLATRHKIIPVAYESDTLQLAMADVYNVLAIDQVRRHMPKSTKIVPIYCTESEILELIDQYYDYEISVDGILREIETGIRDNAKLDGRQEGYINPTVRLVNALLVDAIKTGASDIHFEPEGSFLRLRYRIDGQMQQVRSFHRDYWSAMAVRIKIMASMNIAETRNPQDGRISYNVLGREVDFRVATQPTVHGENIVMRLLDKAKSLVALESLGFSEHNITVLKKLIKRPEGIIIVTGPTGSGKTTTLYSVLSYINGIDVNIMTLEDPVEYQLPLIRQSSVREGTGLDFLNGIKSLMRQDPDIIFVGEVRDEDTALMAVRAALTGHQVYTTLHTNDALGAIPRLTDIGVPAHLLSGSLIGVLAQRLARKLCQHCKKPHKASEEECKILGVDTAKPPTIYEPGGCPRCDKKGYKGRTAIVEILRIDKSLDEMIATHSTRRVMMEYALQNGFVTMQQDGIDKVLKGEITIGGLIDTIDITDRM